MECTPSAQLPPIASRRFDVRPAPSGYGGSLPEWLAPKARRGAKCADSTARAHFPERCGSGQNRPRPEFRARSRFRPARRSRERESPPICPAASRSEAATFEVAGKARQASSGGPSNITVSSLKLSRSIPRSVTYFAPRNAATGLRLVRITRFKRPHRRGPQAIESRNRPRRNVNPATLPLRFREPLFVLQQAAHAHDHQIFLRAQRPRNDLRQSRLAGRLDDQIRTAHQFIEFDHRRTRLQLRRELLRSRADPDPQSPPEPRGSARHRAPWPGSGRWRPRREARL